MPSLLDLQRRFRAGLLAADSTTLSEISGAALAPAARFGIYRNNVIGNLTGALRLTYPAIERLVGRDFFAAAAERFIVTRSPASADLYEYGERFAAFLASFEPARHLAYLLDVARLEWAVNRALHAPETPTLTAEFIHRVPTGRQADLCFVAHPSLSLLSLTYLARTIWEAVLAENSDHRTARLAAIDLAAEGKALAVLRRQGTLELMHLSSTALQFARALVAERPLGEALDLPAPEEAAPLLRSFLAQGFFSRCFPLVTAAPCQEGSISG